MKIIKDADLSEVLWYRIGGKARYLIVCNVESDVVEAFKFLKKEKIDKYFVTGLGSNLLFTDGNYDGAVIQILTSDYSDGIRLVSKDTVGAFAGVTLDSVIQFAFENNLIGLEWAGGLPGTVGAAVRGNVGAFGGEIKDVFNGAEVLKITGAKQEILAMNKRDVKFAYRTSTVKKNPNMIVLTARFKLKSADTGRVGRARQTYLANIEYRKNKHPLDHPSTGSAFKNVSEVQNVSKVLDVFPDLDGEVKIKWHGKVSMGYLIKRLDLSGLKIGNAQISNKHSNFIVNLGGARFQDVLQVINKVRETFEDTFGFVPEAEVEIVE